MSIIKNKLRLGFLSPISAEWFNIHSENAIMAKTVEEADYIIFESNGDPIPLIMNIKARYPKNKLVFILSGDQSAPIDDECIWFSNAVRSSGLAKRQTQIFVSNPAIFKYYSQHIASEKDNVPNNADIISVSNRDIDIYFKGTIWSGMRMDMYNYFKDKPGCVVLENNNYWGWRLNPSNKPTQEELENTAYDTYNDMTRSKICLCPKGNGNSSMRILEALACGSVPVLINDFSAPFGVAWNEIGLVFDTRIHRWDYIYLECQNLLKDNEKLSNMQKKGLEYFKNVVYGDAKMIGFRMYNDINTVCFGFSNKIIEKLITEKLITEKVME